MKASKPTQVKQIVPLIDFTHLSPAMKRAYLQRTMAPDTPETQEALNHLAKQPNGLFLVCQYLYDNSNSNNLSANIVMQCCLIRAFCYLTQSLEYGSFERYLALL